MIPFSVPVPATTPVTLIPVDVKVPPDSVMAGIVISRPFQSVAPEAFVTAPELTFNAVMALPEAAVVAGREMFKPVKDCSVFVKFVERSALMAVSVPAKAVAACAPRPSIVPLV